MARAPMQPLEYEPRPSFLLRRRGRPWVGYLSAAAGMVGLSAEVVLAAGYASGAGRAAVAEPWEVYCGLLAMLCLPGLLLGACVPLRFGFWAHAGCVLNGAGFAGMVAFLFCLR